jgi:hypothetical protein
MGVKYMENLIPAEEFCVSHNITISFIHTLRETGMIELTTIEETVYIHSDQLQELERIVRFYYEMDINLEGIETINHLLQQINSMQHEICSLRNRLRLYELSEMEK